MKKTVLGLAALTALAFAACKKDDNQSNAQKIVGKWQLINNIDVVSNKTTGALIESDTSTYSSGSYREFTSNGYVYSYEKYESWAEYDTVQYKVDGDKVILYYGDNDNDTSVIKTLTGNALTFYNKTIDGNNVWETTQNLKK